MRTKNLPITLSLAFLAMAMTLLPNAARAGNLLVNPSFETNSGNNVPFGWTYFDDPTVPKATHDYWIEGNEATPSGPEDGKLYWKEWGAGYFPTTNNVAGIYQDLGSGAGSIYQANGWFYTSPNDALGANSYVWLEVSFLNASSNILALYKSANFSASVGTGNWFQYQVTNACDLSSPVPTGDSYYTTYAVTGAVTQLVAPAGTAKVRYRFAYLQNTADGGSCYFDAAALDQTAGSHPPIITGLFPLNMIFVNPSDGVHFDVSSPDGSTISNSAIHLVLNGIDVSSNLTITGTSSSKAVSYLGLQSNTVYNASIAVSDQYNLSASAVTYFETTWIGIPPILYLWEAEDFDFNSGMYINNPDLCNAPGDTNCYFGQVGVEEVDENSSAQGNHLYRADDGICTDISGDLLRKNLVDADRTDYEINPFNDTEWVNYTRNWTNGTYWMIARLATDINLSGSLTLSMVNSDSTTTELGTFTIANGLGWTTFENVFLLDTNGNKAALTLNGPMTLQVTSGGNLLPNFFALVVATVDLPILSGMYPTGTQPFEYTNTLSFNIATKGATFPAGGINVNLDGHDVSSALVFTGSSSNETVTYPDLLPNAIHTAIISITNSLGHGILLTNNFDTFSQDNFMVEAEDFDYNGGQFITPWSPDAYAGYDAEAEIDFHHTSLDGEQYPYRTAGIPQEIARDFLRADFVDFGAIDYHLAYYGGGDWANYTRQYPEGGFYVYVRTAGLGAFSMNLAEVTSGVGTSNQVTKSLGEWSAVGVDNQTHEWVELTDNGLSAPAIVRLDGTNTLRITTPTGDCYPNYFMLVPASGIELSATRSGTNAVISFPSQPGVVYRVFYRASLTSGDWTLLTTVLGNGGMEPINIPAATKAAFYKVVTP